jgi:hypothetical protein
MLLLAAPATPVGRRAVPAAPALGAPAPAGAARVVTFDDLPLGRPGAELGDVVPAGYAGFDWYNVFYADALAVARETGGPGYAGGMGSTPCVGVVGGFAMYAEVSRAEPFSFRGGRFAAAFQDGLVLRLTGFVRSAPHYEIVLELGTARPQALAVQWDDVTRVRFDPWPAPAGSQVVLDDLRFGPPDAGPPHPTALLGVGPRPTSPLGGFP